MTKKWRTIVEYTDKETGEVIPKNEFWKNYVKIKTVNNPQIEETEKYIIRKYVTIGEKNRQTKLF